MHETVLNVHIGLFFSAIYIQQFWQVQEARCPSCSGVKSEVLDVRVVDGRGVCLTFRPKTRVCTPSQTNNYCLLLTMVWPSNPSFSCLNLKEYSTDLALSCYNWQNSVQWFLKLLYCFWGVLLAYNVPWSRAFEQYPGFVNCIEKSLILSCLSLLFFCNIMGNVNILETENYHSSSLSIPKIQK